VSKKVSFSNDRLDSHAEVRSIGRDFADLVTLRDRLYAQYRVVPSP